MNKEIIEKLRGMGFNMIPCAPQSKRPLIQWLNYQDNKYTGQIPDSGNAAVICGKVSGVVVIDIDSPELTTMIFDNFETIKQKTLVVQTGSGGYHIYVKPQPDDVLDTKHLTNPSEQHMDIQANKAYVIAPTSIHPNGNEYKIISSTTEIMNINLNKFIEGLRQFGFNTEGAGLKPIFEIAKGVGSGDRNNSAFKYICHLLSRVGLDRESAWSETLRWNSLNKPPIVEAELKAVFESACKRVGSNKKQEEPIKLSTKDQWQEELKIRIGNEYDIEKLRRTNEIYLNVDNPFMQEMMTKYPSSFMDMVKESLRQYGLDCRNVYLTMEPTLKMHDISISMSGKIICFDCEIIACEDKQSYTKSCDLVCPECEATTMAEMNERRAIPTEKCRMCKRRPNMVVSDITMESGDARIVYLREFMEDARHNQPMPLESAVYDDMVREVFVGHRKRVIGTLRSIPHKTGMFNDILFDIISITGLDETRLQFPTPEEITEWTEKVKDPNFFDNLASEFAIDNEGHLDIKKTAILSVAGCPKTKYKINNIHYLLYGDPGTYKTTMIERAKDITAISVFTSGTGSSKAGLTGGMDRLAPNTPLVFIPGALTSANKGHCYIDEFDKMEDHEQSALLTAMAKGYIPINKMGMQGILPADTAIGASANPKGGKWREGIPLLDQTNIKEPLLSRLDLIWLYRDVVDEFKDTKISNKIMNQMNPSEEQIHDSEKIKRYLNYVRENFFPELTEEAKKKVTQFYVQLRRMSLKINTIPIDPRRTESIAKIAMAHARIHMKDVADVSDVEFARELMRRSLESFDIDLDSGNIEQPFHDRKDLNKEETMLACIKSCEDSYGSISYESLVEALANSKHFDEESAKDYINKWEIKGRLQRNADKTLRR